jgi:zinc transport system substrate-binding protein
MQFVAIHSSRLMWRLSIHVALLILVLASGCAQQPVTDKVHVTCSIFPLADIVSNIGKDNIEVHVLIPPGASPHTFEPSPQQFKAFADTDLFLMVGAGFEFWAEKLVTAVSSESVLVVRASDGVELLDPLGSHHHDHGAAPHADVGNPHIWLDPTNAKKIAFQVAASLAEIDLNNANYYLENANRYSLSLHILDVEIQEAVSGFTTKEYVAFHPAWSYFAKRYGLKEVGVIEKAPGKEPTPKQLKKIIEDIRKYKIKAVFAEPQLSPKAASAIAAEAGVEMLMLDPIGGRDLPGRDSYLALMRYNLETMRKAMQ